MMSTLLKPPLPRSTHPAPVPELAITSVYSIYFTVPLTASKNVIVLGLN